MQAALAVQTSCKRTNSAESKDGNAPVYSLFGHSFSSHAVWCLWWALCLSFTSHASKTDETWDNLGSCARIYFQACLLRECNTETYFAPAACLVRSQMVQDTRHPHRSCFAVCTRRSPPAHAVAETQSLPTNRLQRYESISAHSFFCCQVAGCMTALASSSSFVEPNSQHYSALQRCHQQEAHTVR